MIKLSSFEGGGGYFSIESRVDVGSISLSAGTLLSVPAVEGKVYRLFYLANSGTAAQLTTNITLNIDGNAIYTDESLGGPTGVNSVIKNTIAGNAFDAIFCKSFSIVGEAGVSGRPLFVGYEIGSFKQ